MWLREAQITNSIITQICFSQNSLVSFYGALQCLWMTLQALEWGSESRYQYLDFEGVKDIHVL